MPKKKKTIFNILLFLLLITITFIIIFKNYNLIDTINIMLSAKTIYVILTIITMLIYISLEALNIKSILKSLNRKVPFLKMLRYTFIGFFFSGITPGGSGGQPMEIYCMKKENIPITASTLSLLLHLCSFHIVTIILGIIALFMNYSLITNSFIWIFIIGMTLKVITLSAMMICLFSKRTSKILINLLIKILKIFKYSKIDEITENLNKSLITYNQGSVFIKEHKKIFLKSLFIVFIEVIAYYTVTYFVYLSFGLNTYNYLTIISVQALLLVSTSSIPLPGAVGISESAFLTINEKLFTKTYLPSAMLLSRGISFYLFMFISFVIVIINTIKLKSNLKN